ncbi:Zinc finger BED domain-containing protein RICESLEEPER 2 [Fusarium oxysporum f. sp. rapae]|uniref:Zinc finger BED domain-containing protein RICESLEEPER 2 n=1 Tax=Fusarium oxysporum f. sp. rapae TaxID=485398 RepID=A0A8J5NMC8_FUSOX|nr:Zinc finger BED domain-containing protein RICESLEEPER 2 [Fusarium oxysporum f. sp. rapae]
MTSQRPGISVSFTATSSQTSLAPDSSVISDNRDSDVGETSISPFLASQFKKKKRTSKIWDHTPFGSNQIVRNTEGQIIWRCKYCKGKPAEYLENGGTAHIYKHLKSHTTLDILTPNVERAAKTRNHLEEAFSRMSQNTNPLKRRRHDDETTDLDADKFEQLYVEWIADCGIELRMPTRESFRALLKFLNPGVLLILPTSHQTIREWVRTFETQKRRIRQVLQSAISKIHFTVDIWSSPNKLRILGIVAHFIDSNGELVSYCVALREVHGRHSGENQAHIVMIVVEDYGVATHIGYFVSDNADSNDTLMNSLQKLLNERHNIIYDAKHHRLRCNGHTINLAAHAFMFPKTAPDEAPTKNQVKKDTTSDYIKPSDADILKWRKAGPLGKLHNIVVFIRCSPQRIQRFKEISEKKGLLRDNDTRWNSKYYMIERAIELADQIDYYCSKEKDLKLDSLSQQDWAELKKICNFLKSFTDATKAAEGHAHAIDRTLPIMVFLLSKFEAARIEYADDAFMAPCIDAGWAKLDAYYTLTERSSAYVGAIVLSPHRKWHYFDTAWEEHPEWIESNKTAVEDLWKSRYAPVAK